MPWYFVRDNPNNSGCTGRLGLVDCTMVRAAHRAFFNHGQSPSLQSRPSSANVLAPWVDGGVGVTGNPVYQACIEVFRNIHPITSRKHQRLIGHRQVQKQKNTEMDWVLALMDVVARITGGATNGDYLVAISSNDLLICR